MSPEKSSTIAIMSARMRRLFAVMAASGLFVMACGATSVPDPSQPLVTVNPAVSSGPLHPIIPTPSPSTIGGNPSPTTPIAAQTALATPTAIAAPTTASTASPAPTATATATAASAGSFEWKPSSPDSGLGTVRLLKASAAANGRFVVIALDEDYQPVILTSGNGTRWDRATVAEAGSDEPALADVAAGGPGFVAVGESGAYISSDGQTWERVDDPDFGDWRLYRVGSAGSTTVAFATDADGEAFAIFTSTDGRDWQVSPDAIGTPLETQVLAVAPIRDALAVLSTDPTEEFVCERPITVSETVDGVTWIQLGTLPNSKGAECGGTAELAIGSQGWVAWANLEPGDLTARGTVWHSNDGTAWQRAPKSLDEVTDLFADTNGYVAVAHWYTGGPCEIDQANIIGKTWTSPDGLAWSEMPDQGWRHREVDLLRRSGRTLIGIGVDWTADPNGAIWTADLDKLASADEPQATPSPEVTDPPGC